MCTRRAPGGRSRPCWPSRASSGPAASSSGEDARRPERAVDLVGRDVDEAHDVVARARRRAAPACRATFVLTNGRPERIERSTWLSAAKWTTMSGALRRVEGPAHVVRLRDVAVHEGVVHFPAEVLEVAGVRERVEVDDRQSGRSSASMWTKLLPMNPAPPVTRTWSHGGSRRGSLWSASRQGASRARAAPRARAVEHAVRRPPRRARELRGRARARPSAPGAPSARASRAASSYQVHAPSQAAW